MTALVKKKSAEGAPWRACPESNGHLNLSYAVQVGVWLLSPQPVQIEWIATTLNLWGCSRPSAGMRKRRMSCVDGTPENAYECRN